MFLSDELCSSQVRIVVVCQLIVWELMRSNQLIDCVQTVSDSVLEVKFK